MATVVVLQINGPPHVNPPIVSQASDGTILLDYVPAVTSGRTVKRFNRGGGFHISKWTSQDDTISWNANVNWPGLFEVTITYAAQPAWDGQPFTIEVDGKQLQATVKSTGDSYQYKSFFLGTLSIVEPGQHSVVIRPAADINHDLMYFRAMTMKPDRR